MTLFIALTCLLVASLAVNMVCILPYATDYMRRDTSPYYGISDSDELVISSVVKASMELSASSMPQNEYRGLLADLKAMCKPKRNADTFNNYYIAYNYAGLSQYATIAGDPGVIGFLKDRADQWLDQEGKLNYSLEKVDQAPIGIMYINLFKITGNPKYKTAAEHIYNFIKSKRTEGDLIPYNNEIRNFSDAVGMFVPFLMEYYSLSHDELALRIAENNLNHYKAYGTDKDTHLPFHGYDVETKIKLGSCNWGRGMGWYLLAIAYCPQMNDAILSSNVEKLPYTQFPLSSNRFDSSTALMFELYKQGTDSARTLNLDFIRTHIRRNGLVSDCSGDTYNLNDYSHSFGNSELCNGLLLLLYSKYHGEHGNH